MGMFSKSLLPTQAPLENPGSWNLRKGRLKAIFPVLTDEDLELEMSRRDEMFSNLLSKLGKTPSELHAIIIAM